MTADSQVDCRDQDMNVTRSTPVMTDSNVRQTVGRQTAVHRLNQPVEHLIELVRGWRLTLRPGEDAALVRLPERELVGCGQEHGARTAHHGDVALSALLVRNSQDIPQRLSGGASRW